jgi:hypothetical protein
MKKLQ